MKTRLLFLFAALSLSFGLNYAKATTYTWTGNKNSLWSVAANWLPKGNPGAGDDVQIPATAKFPRVDIASSCASVTITGNTTLTLLQSLTVSGGFTINSVFYLNNGAANLNVGGVFLINNGASVKTGLGCVLTFGSIKLGSNAFFVNKDATTSNGAIDIGYLSYISNTGVFNVSGNITASLTGHINNFAAGTFNVNGSAAIFLGFQSYLYNAGVASVNTGGITVGDTARLNNTAGATFSTNGPLLMKFDGKIANGGTFTANSDSIGMGVNALINNSATGTFSEKGSVINMGYRARIVNSGIFGIKKANVRMGAAGNITNNTDATFTINGNASIDFAANTADSAYISNNGTFHAGTSNSSCVIHLNYSGVYVKNTGTFHLGSTSVINLTGFATHLDNTGSFTLHSDAFGCGALGNISGNSAVVTGTYSVERYISGGSPVYRSYRLLSSPVSTAVVGGNNVYSLNYVQLSSLVTGTGGPAGGFDKAGNPSLYLFRDNIAGTNMSFTSSNFRGISDISAAPSYSLDVDGSGFSIPSGNGFMFFFRGDRTTNLANKYTPGTSAESVVMTATGTLNTGKVTVKPWFTPSLSNLDYTAVSGNASVLGFALVGNPYPSSIDWDTYNTNSANSGIYAPQVSKFIYVLDPVSKNYNVYQSGSGGIGTIANSNSNVIPSGQGFFVQASSAAAQLVFNESAKINAQATAAKTNLFLGTPAQSDVAQYLRLQLAKDSINQDDIYVGFSTAFSPNYVIDEDARYLQGQGQVNLCSMSADNMPCAINKLPLPKQKPVIINLMANAATDGIYSLNLTQLVAIPEIYEVWLMDAYKKDSLDMRLHKTYLFNITKADTNSYGMHRFKLVIRENPALGVHLLNFTATKTNDGAQMVWLTENEQNYTRFTVERSTDGGATFTILGGVLANAQGTYGFLDKTPALPADEYRLRIEDLNGAFTYSNIVTLTYGSTAGTLVRNITVYPNPAINVVNLAINADSGLPLSKTNGIAVSLNNNQVSYGIKIINISGAVVKTATSSSASWKDDVGGLSPGTYIIQVTNAKDNSLVGKSTFVKL